MTLKKRFARQKGDFPRRGVAGQEGEWLAIGKLDAPKGTLCAVDVTLFNEDDGFVVKAPPGKYVVEGKVMDFNGHLRVSRVRAYLDGTTPRLGKEVGETGTDSAMIAICDIKHCDAGMTDEDNEVFAEKLFDVEVDGGDVKTVKIGKKKTITFAVCETGLGDGGYPVFSLVDGKRTVGLEVEFLPGDFVMEDDVS